MNPRTHYHNRLIFLCEDDEDDVAIFTDVLLKICPGCILKRECDGERLLELISQLHPDLLFLDLDTPRKNGLQVLEELRKQDRFKNLPIIIFSSSNRPGNIETAYLMGANLFYSKPSQYAELMTSLEAILSLDWSDPAKVTEQYCVNGRYVAFL